MTLQGFSLQNFKKETSLKTKIRRKLITGTFDSILVTIPYWLTCSGLTNTDIIISDIQHLSFFMWWLLGWQRNQPIQQPGSSQSRRLSLDFSKVCLVSSGAQNRDNNNSTPQQSISNFHSKTTPPQKCIKGRSRGWGNEREEEDTTTTIKN